MTKQAATKSKPQRNAMDLTNFDTDTTLMLHLAGPDGELLEDDKTHEPVAIWIYGKYSKKYETHQRELVNGRVKKRMRGGRMRTPRIEDTEMDGIILMAKVTAKWQNIIVDGPLECNYENARSLYEQFPWVREQVAELIEQGVENLGE